MNIKLEALILADLFDLPSSEVERLYATFLVSVELLEALRGFRTCLMMVCPAAGRFLDSSSR